MLRHLLPFLCIAFVLSGCKRVLELSAKFGDESQSGELEGESEPWSPQIQSDSAAKPEIVTAFQEISNAAYLHNVAFVQRYDAGQPCNGPAYSEGIRALDKAARQHGGMTKQIIDAVNLTLIQEKSIFVAFDTMDRQLAGMKTRGGNAANQRRAYIQIIDHGIRTYDHAITYLESGEETRLRHNFTKKKVPSEVALEFLRLKEVHGEKTSRIQKEMLNEGRAALQSYRTAYSQTDPARANTYLAEGRRHDQKSNQLMAQMVAEIRKQLSRSPRA